MSEQAKPAGQVAAERRATFHTVASFRALDDEARAWLLREAVEVAARDAERQAAGQARAVGAERLRVEITVRVREET